MKHSKVIYNREENDFIVPEGEKLGISNLMWHITDACSLACPHCFSKGEKGELSIEGLSRYIELFQELGVQKIDLSGGEPLLHSGLPQICAALSKARIHYTVTTSAFVGEEALKWLVKNAREFARIILSINAPSPNLHEELNGGKGSFQKICNLARNLRNCGNIRINTVCTPKICTYTEALKFVDLIEELLPMEWCIIEKFEEGRTTLETSYIQFLELVKGKKFTRTRMITRNGARYADYYVLSADGHLYSRGKPKEKIAFKDAQEILSFLHKGENYGTDD